MSEYATQRPTINTGEIVIPVKGNALFEFIQPNKEAVQPVSSRTPESAPYSSAVRGEDDIERRVDQGLGGYHDERERLESASGEETPVTRSSHRRHGIEPRSDADSSLDPEWNVSPVAEVTDELRKAARLTRELFVAAWEQRVAATEGPVRAAALRRAREDRSRREV